MKYLTRQKISADVNPQPEMYRVTLRLLETADEHFYPAYYSNIIGPCMPGPYPRKS